MPDASASNAEASARLFHATMTGDVDEALEAIAEGADVNYTNAHGMGPLLVCSGGVGPLSMMKLLVENGASLEERDRLPDSMWTALLYVASSGQMHLLEYLIERGANVNFHSPQSDWRPLTRAAYRGHTLACAALLQAGADARATSLGRTALQWAEHQGHEETAAELRQWGGGGNGAAALPQQPEQQQGRQMMM
jgi:ankyrin repeat protein